jgi:hypothetical protein
MTAPSRLHLVTTGVKRVAWRTNVLRRPLLSAAMQYSLRLAPCRDCIAFPVAAAAAGAAGRSAAAPAGGTQPRRRHGGPAAAPRTVRAPPSPGAPRAHGRLPRRRSRSPTSSRTRKQIDGLFTLWQKDDKVWLELKPSDSGQPFFLSPKIRGIGEAGFYGGLMVLGRLGRPQIVSSARAQPGAAAGAQHRVHRASGHAQAAPSKPPSRPACWPAPRASQPHPERKSVLVEANALFLTTCWASAIQLQRAYRQGYYARPRNSRSPACAASPTRC